MLHPLHCCSPPGQCSLGKALVAGALTREAAWVTNVALFSLCCAAGRWP